MINKIIGFKPRIKSYFYKDNHGNIQSYIYCSYCVAQFKKVDIDKNIFLVSDSKTKIYACTACKKRHLTSKSIKSIDTVYKSKLTNGELKRLAKMPSELLLRTQNDD